MVIPKNFFFIFKVAVECVVKNHCEENLFISINVKRNAYTIVVHLDINNNEIRG
jgi:hypothetical protein